MLRARILLRANRLPRFLHSASTLQKQPGKDKFLNAQTKPAHDPFAAFKEQDKKDLKEDTPWGQQDSFFDGTFADDASLKFGDFLDEIRPTFGSENSDFSNPDLDNWYRPENKDQLDKDRYFMSKDVDMTPLRGLSEDLGTHMIPKPDYDPEINSQANYEKIFARVMGEFNEPKFESRGVSRDVSHRSRDSRAQIEHLIQSSGVEDTPSLDSPYIRLFDCAVPDMFVKICAEPDMEVRHGLIEDLDLKECSEVEKVIGKELQKLIQVQSDYDLLQFMDKKLDLIEELSKEENLPSELPPLALGFPILLNESLQLLVEQFESPTEAVSLFRSVKERSGRLYFATVSADVYLSMIRITWEFYRDIGGLVSLASDVAMMNIKSRAIVSTLSDIEKITLSLLKKREQRGYNNSVGARVQQKGVRRFSQTVEFLRLGLVEEGGR